MTREHAPRWWDGHRLAWFWGAAACAVLGTTATLVAARSWFDWSKSLAEIPAVPLTIGLIGAGLAFQAMLPLVRRVPRADTALQRQLMILIVAVGLAARLMLFLTEPALEDDQQRYLWEGAMVANGLNPYAISPAAAKIAAADTPLGRLAHAAGPVLERVNHPALTSIYPPVAQAFFALAYGISPFSLNAWRLVLLVADLVSLYVIVKLLAATGRHPVWCALYWWNPIVLKELFNSAHMEGALTPFVLLSLLASVRQRHMSAAALLGMGVGVKVWPLLLAPLILRPLLARPSRLVLASGLLTALCAVWAWPILMAGLHDRSGFVAYAGDWQMNSALLPALRETLRWLAAQVGLGEVDAGRAARVLLALVAAGTALACARRPVNGPRDLLDRAALVTLVLVLVSPAQFPWYMIWTLPLLPFRPRLGVMAMAVTLPVYYLWFHFVPLNAQAYYREFVVWFVWVPIWGLLACEAMARVRMRRLRRARVQLSRSR